MAKCGVLVEFPCRDSPCSFPSSALAGLTRSDSLLASSEDLPALELHMGPREPHQKNPQEKGLLIIWRERRLTLGASRESRRFLQERKPNILRLAPESWLWQHFPI